MMVKGFCLRGKVHKDKEEVKVTKYWKPETVVTDLANPQKFNKLCAEVRSRRPVPQKPIKTQNERSRTPSRRQDWISITEAVYPETNSSLPKGESRCPSSTQQQTKFVPEVVKQTDPDAKVTRPCWGQGHTTKIKDIRPSWDWGMVSTF